jgi:hypothetical protein
MHRRILLFLIPALPALCAANTGSTLLDTGFRQMYNLDFATAHQTFHEWETLHPEDPMGPASDAAAYLFSEFERLHILQSEFFIRDQHFITDHKLTPDPNIKQNFMAALQASRNLAARTPAEPNSMFASILSSGLECNYFALIEKRYGASFQKMKASRVMAEHLLAAHPEYTDAWLAVGVENYMLSIKPAAVRFFLRLGGGQMDRALGIEKLKLTAASGRYLGPFAKLLLGVAALRDGDTGQARNLLEMLARDFPQNHLYREELTRLGHLAFNGEPR